jgi:lipopolysaccharide export system protein LptC
MTTAAGTGTADDRSAIYASLATRNRIVGTLRIGLPAIGAIIFLGLILQLYLGTMVPDFGFANVRIDRENLVFEAPSYTGTGTDGTAYSLGAESARAGLRNTDLVELQGAALSMLKPDGMQFAARAATAQFSMRSQVVTVEGSTVVSSNSGLSGTVKDAVVDVLKETLIAPGGAELTFANGSTLSSDTMAFDGTRRLWTFNGRVKLNFAETPGESIYQPSEQAAETSP